MSKPDRQSFGKGASWIPVLLLLSMVLILAACSSASPTPPKAIVIDDLGRSVNIEKIPQRIISLAPSNTEILFALGLGEKVVGVTEHCNYPEQWPCNWPDFLKYSHDFECRCSFGNFAPCKLR